MTEMGASDLMNTSESPCNLGPPPDMILHLPPPPFPNFLPYKTDPYSNVDLLTFLPHLNNSPCKHLCDWKSEGVQYVDIPQQGSGFDDTWLLILISFCVGIIFIGIILTTLFLKCKIKTNSANRNGKNGVISMPTTNSSMSAKCGRIENDTILYPCAAETLQDGRVMWATLTPRGTTRHYLEDHTYETISNGTYHKRLSIPAATEHTYTEPPVIRSPIMSTNPKMERAFDNTGFVDYEEPLSLESEYYQVEDNLDIHEMGGFGIQTLRPRVSSPTRIEHPNLPPLNLHPHKTAYHKIINQRASDTILRSGIPTATYIPTI